MVLNNDNEKTREAVEFCYRQRKTMFNPIIDWTTDEVWEFIREYNVPYCELYDKGHKRLGCIGCPMNSAAAGELEEYPRYKKLYLRAFQKLVDDPDTKWQDAEVVYKWWLQL